MALTSAVNGTMRLEPAELCQLIESKRARTG